MHQQKICSPRLNILQGLGAVLGILAVIFAASVITSMLVPVIGNTAATIIFWAIGVSVALWTMRRFVLSYTYALGPNVLRISFAYGRYERVMNDLYFNNILNAGTLEDMRARYPSARVNRATRPACAFPELAIAVRDDGKPAIYLLQPDETIRETIEDVAKKNRK